MSASPYLCDRCGSDDVDPPNGPVTNVRGWSGGVYRFPVQGPSAVVSRVLCREHLAEHEREAAARETAEHARVYAPRLAANALADRIRADVGGSALRITPSDSLADEPGAGTVVIHGRYEVRIRSWEEWCTLRPAYLGTHRQRERINAALTWVSTAHYTSIRRWRAGGRGPYAPNLDPASPEYACVALILDQGASER